MSRSALLDEQLEIIDLRTSRDEELLEEIYDGLYKRSFPFEEEREDLEFWRQNLWEPTAGSLVVHFLVAGHGLGDGQSRQIAGFLGSEYYPESRVGLVTYIAASPEWRGRGIGRALLDAGFRALENDASAAGGQLRAVFAEIHEPTRIESNRDSIPPRDRVAIMARYGAKRVPIPYVQPALGGSGERAYGLMLVAFPLRGRSFPRGQLSAETVSRFLRELYSTAEGEVREDDRDFSRMLNALTEDVELEELVQEENPALRLTNYGIAFHFAAWQPSPVEITDGCPEIDSFERDMLAYAYRGSRRPFASQVDLKPELRRLRVRFPAHVSFVSEGRPVTLLRAGANGDEGTRSVELRIARTDFRSGVSILHLVLNASGNPDSMLNEYYVIKLAKFWEGGEGVHEPVRGLTDAALFTVQPEGGDETTLLAIADEAFGEGAHPTELRAGTVQVLIDDSDTARLCEAVGELKRAEGAASLDPATRREVTAVGGILQGLLDFEEIDLDELADVFKDIEPEKVRMDSIKKGTLFSLTNRDRAMEAAEAVGVSPYLLVPHAILLHNEALLKRAVQIANALPDPGRAEDRSWTTRLRFRLASFVERAVSRSARLQDLWERLRRRWRHRLARIERDRREVARLLNDLVPNVFNYKAEQDVYERGWKSRSLDNLKAEVENRLTELDTDIDKRHSRLRDVAAQTIALLLLGFSAVQTAERINPAIVYPIYVVIGLIYLVLILRR
jgi:GNAT superfamily N-acetyltransferase